MPSKITPDSPALSASAPDRLRDWLARLAETGRLPADLDAAALTAAVAASGRRMTARIGLALLQEGVLEPRADNAGQKVEIPDGAGDSRILLISGLSPEQPSLFPEISFQRQDREGRSAPVEDPVELLALIAPLLGEAQPEDLTRLMEEVADAQFNDALCAAHRALYDSELVQKSAAAGCVTFRDWILCREVSQDPTVLLEQWSAVGHPYHPTHKTRRGMSPGEALSYCPEFRPRVQLRLAAVRRERLRGESLPEGPAIDRWLDHYLPAEAEAWRSVLEDRGLDPDDYAALPVHPWQAEHAVPKHFTRSIAQGDLLLLEEPLIPADPLVSVRTLVPATAAEAPHLKLSLSVRLTSVERTISPRSCEMGPRISKLLEGLIGRDEILAATLRVLPEEIGLYFASAHAEEAEESKHLAAILRGSPGRLCGDGGIMVPGTALAAASPVSGAPFLLELGEDDVLTDPAEARAHFARYAEAYLRPLLTLYLRYGISLEAHLQNSLLHCDSSGRMLRCVFRDFGGIRIHEPSLRAAGLDLEVHPDRLTVVDSRDEVRSKLTARGIHYHLGFLISCVCRYLGVDEGSFWSDAAALVATIFDENRADIEQSVWRQERAAFLERDWDYKTSLRMRIQGLSGDLFRPGPNPLRWGK